MSAMVLAFFKFEANSFINDREATTWLSQLFISFLLAAWLSKHTTQSFQPRSIL